MSFILQQCDEEVWNEVAKQMRPRPTIRKLVDVMFVIKCQNQVDGEKISARRDAVFEDYKDDVLSGKLLKNSNSPNSPIQCENGEAKIEIIQGSKVHKQRPFYLHGTKVDALRKMIERNLHEFGWLEGCMSSEWYTAPFTVPKAPPSADQFSIDAWRLVVDYRALNAATVPGAHPLPLIEEETAKRAKGMLFTVLDLRHGFHQMPLRKEDRHLTAMCTPCGTDQWTVMPMCLKNAPSMFQKMMETILFQKHKALGLQEFCSIYIYELLIATPLGKDFDECLTLHEEENSQSSRSRSTREARVWTQEGQNVPPECGILWLYLGRWDMKTSLRENGCPAGLGKALNHHAASCLFRLLQLLTRFLSPLRQVLWSPDIGTQGWQSKRKEGISSQAQVDARM